MFESILKAPVLFFDRNPIGKSDTKFLSKYVLLTYLASDCISVFESGGDARDAWKKITVRVDLFSTKSFTDIFLRPEKIWIEGAYKLLFQFMCVCVEKNKWRFTWQNGWGIHLLCGIQNTLNSVQTCVNVVD